jgi:hypothetical protein
MYLLIKNILVISGFFSGLGVVMISCDRIYSNYLQTDLTPVTEVSEVEEFDGEAYSNRILALIPASKEKESLIYTRGDYSFQIIRYAHKEQPVLYVERGESGEHGKLEKKYFIKDGKIVFIQEHEFPTNAGNPHLFKSVRFDGGNLKAEQKAVMNIAELTKSPAIDIVYDFAGEQTQLNFFEDALNQRNAFDLKFEEIAESPKAKYLILTRSGINAYRAPIKVEKEDEFIREISSNPLRYRGEKLDLKWTLNAENEAVYASCKLSQRN